MTNAANQAKMKSIPYECAFVRGYYLLERKRRKCRLHNAHHECILTMNSIRNAIRTYINTKEKNNVEVTLVLFEKKKIDYASFKCLNYLNIWSIVSPSIFSSTLKICSSLAANGEGLTLCFSLSMTVSLFPINFACDNNLLY